MHRRQCGADPECYDLATPGNLPNSNMRVRGQKDPVQIQWGIPPRPHPTTTQCSDTKNHEHKRRRQKHRDRRERQSKNAQKQRDRKNGQVVLPLFLESTKEGALT